MKTLWFAILLALTTAAAPGAAASTRPNLIIILVDDMGWADGGCFGSKFYETPNLDALAARGMRFTQAYAAAAVCSPTRAALLTGKYPARLRITDWIGGEKAPATARFTLPAWQKHLPREEITLAEVLRKAGYATAHIGKWHLGPPEFFPEYQGFVTNIAGGAIGHPASFFWPYGETNHSHRVPQLAARGGRPGDYLTDQLTEEALQFITAQRTRPFFLNLWHYAVHAPLQGKPELIAAAARRPGADGQSNAVYAAMLRSVDESVGRIVKALDSLRLAENTMVIFTSDNGGAVHLGKPAATANGILRNGKGTAYEGGLRVPLLVQWPAVVRGGSLCHRPVITMDFFPTLLAATQTADAALLSGCDGANLLPLLQGADRSVHDELFWHYPHYWNGGKVSPYSVVRMADWKLIRFYETGREELYDLGSDPSERNDLAAGNLEKRKMLSARLDAWLQEVGAQMPVPK